MLFWVLLFCCCSSTNLVFAQTDDPAAAGSLNNENQTIVSAPAVQEELQQQQQQQDERVQLCKQWGLQPAAAGAKAPRVFDFFIASYELDMMEIRLHETYQDLDHIFILAARQTFRGNNKPLAYPHLLPKLHGDIIRKVHYTVLESLEGNITWEKEAYQRNALFETALASSGIQPEPNDVLIVSDLDEIPKPAFIRAMKQCAGIVYPASLLSDMHYYAFEYVSGQEWDIGPLAVQAQQLGNWTPQALRAGVQWGKIEATRYKKAAWHCSYCFSHASMFRAKLSSFSHSEFDTPDYHDITRLVGCLREGWGLFQGNIGQPGASPDYKRLPADQLDVPEYVRQHSKRFAYLLSRNTSETGGLLDVEMQGGKAQMKKHNQTPKHEKPEHHRHKSSSSKTDTD